MERKGSKQREQQASEFLYFRRFYLFRLRLNNLCVVRYCLIVFALTCVTLQKEYHQMLVLCLFD